jgi:hypothetical protein
MFQFVSFVITVIIIIIIKIYQPKILFIARSYIAIKDSKTFNYKRERGPGKFVRAIK